MVEFTGILVIAGIPLPKDFGVTLGANASCALGGECNRSLVSAGNYLG